jgi:hypothetical protein
MAASQRFKIEKNVPIPHRCAYERYPFGDMNVGDSIFVSQHSEKARTSASYYGKRNGKKFSCRAEGVGLRIWRTK